MKKLNVTKEAFEKSQYFKNKYGKLEYVSESGKVFKTNKGKILKFKESSNTKDEPYSVYKFINTLRWDYNEYMLEEPRILGGIGDGWKEISIMCSKSQYRKMLGVVKKYCQKYGWEYQSHKIDDDVFEIIVSEWDESTLTDDFRESTKKFGKKFTKESASDDIYGFYEWLENSTQYDSGIHVHYYDNEDGSETVELRFDDRYQWDDEVESGDKSKEDDAGVQDWMRLIERKSIKNHWTFDTEEYDGEFIISVRSPNAEDDEEEFMVSDKKFDESMNWNGVTDKFIDNDTVQFTRKCPSCGKPHSITVSIRDVEDGMSEYGRGAMIQDAFPNFSPEEREFFMTGICPDCWKNM